MGASTLEGKRRQTNVLALVILAASTLVPAAGALPPVDVEPFGDAKGTYAAVSVTGTAYAAGVGVSASNDSAGTVAVSGHGDSFGSVLVVSGNGNATCGFAQACTAVAGDGVADGWQAVTVFGDADGRYAYCNLDAFLWLLPCLPGHAVSVFGDADGSNGDVAVCREVAESTDQPACDVLVEPQLLP